MSVPRTNGPLVSDTADNLFFLTDFYFVGVSNKPCLLPILVSYFFQIMSEYDPTFDPNISRSL